MGTVDFPPPQPLRIEILEDVPPKIKTAKLVGPVTVHNFVDFQELTRQQPVPKVFIIDISEVPYLDSAALGTFVGLHVACEGTERKYGLVGPNERLKSLFVLSNVAAFLVTFGTLAEARAALL